MITNDPDLTPFKNEDLVIRAEQDLPGTEGERGGKVGEGSTVENNSNNVCTCE
jgi:hypothetical protein